MALLNALEQKLHSLEKRVEFCRYAINDMQKEGIWVRGLLMKPKK